MRQTRRNLARLLWKQSKLFPPPPILCHSKYQSIILTATLSGVSHCMPSTTPFSSHFIEVCKYHNVCVGVYICSCAAVRVQRMRFVRSLKAALRCVFSMQFTLLCFASIWSAGKVLCAVKALCWCWLVGGGQRLRSSALM